jgi:Clostripain family.
MAGCQKYDDAELRNNISQTDSKIDKLGSEDYRMEQLIAAISDKDYLEDATPINEGSNNLGYSLYFNKAGEVVIFYADQFIDDIDAKDPKFVELTLTDGDVIKFPYAKTIESIMESIQSISVIPDCQDGSVEIERGTTTLTIDIKPESVAEEIINCGVWNLISFSTYKASTKASSAAEVKPLKPVGAKKDGSQMQLQFSSDTLGKGFFNGDEKLTGKVNVLNSSTVFPIQPKTNLSTVILMYGATGNGNDLDHVQIGYLLNAASVGCNNNVKVIAEYNFFPEAQIYPNLRGTKRMLVKSCNEMWMDWNAIDGEIAQNPNEWNNIVSKYSAMMLDSCIAAGGVEIVDTVSETPIELYDSNNLAAFIKWSVEHYPADNYILDITGHGGGWTSHYDTPLPETKGLAWDANHYEYSNECIHARTIVDAVKKSGAENKIKLLMLDACTMNQIENVAEFATTKIPLAILCYQNSKGHYLHELVNCLKNVRNNDQAFLSAIYKYCANNPNPDHTLWSLDDVGNILKLVKEAVPMFKKEYIENKEYYNQWLNSLNLTGLKIGDPNLPAGKTGVRDFRVKDFSQFWAELSDNAKTPELRTLAFKVYRSIGLSVYGTWFSDSSPIKAYSRCSASFLTKDEYYYQIDRNSRQAFDENAFYTATGWNSLFEVFDGFIQWID